MHIHEKKRKEFWKRKEGRSLPLYSTGKIKPFIIFLNIGFIFYSFILYSFRFTAKLTKYRVPTSSPALQIQLLPPSASSPDGTFLVTDEPILTDLYHLKSIVYNIIHSWCRVFDKCIMICIYHHSILNMEYFHCPKNPLGSAYSLIFPTVPQLSETTDFFLFLFF